MAVVRKNAPKPKNDFISDLIKMMTESDKKRDRGLKPPKDVDRFTDIAYGPDPKTQSLDVYRPKELRGTLPVIVSIHGGGWIYGDKELYQHYCMSLAQRGFAVINYTYRLAPAHKYPACIEDANLVFQWLADHAAQYGFDTDHVFAVGDSAGANQLAVYGCILSSPAYASSYPFPVATGFKLRAVALNCGLYDPAAGTDGDDNPIYKAMFAHKGTRAELEQMTPTHYVTSSFPAAFIMTANGDTLADTSTALAHALLEKMVPIVKKVYGTEEEPLGHVFHCNMKLDQARICNDEECAFFRRFLA